MQPLPHLHPWTQIHHLTQHNPPPHQTHGILSLPKSRPPLSKYDKRHFKEKLNTNQSYTNSAKTWKTPTLGNKLKKQPTSKGT